MKMIFVVFEMKQDGKYYAVADTIRTGENLVSYCRRFHADICHLCESRKQAEQIAAEWNESYRKNGTHLYLEKTKEDLNSQLILATKNNKPKEMLRLIEEGADVNCQDAYGIPVILMATNMADSHTIELLVEHGADVNARKPDGTSKLMLFASYGDPDVVSYLLEHGADPHLQNQEGKDALHYARDCSSWCEKYKVAKYQKVIELLENAMNRC